MGLYKGTASADVLGIKAGDPIPSLDRNSAPTLSLRNALPDDGQQNQTMKKIILILTALASLTIAGFPGDIGRYQLIVTQSAAYKIDTTTGQTWVKYGSDPFFQQIYNSAADMEGTPSSTPAPVKLLNDSDTEAFKKKYPNPKTRPHVLIPDGKGGWREGTIESD
jgi:hypothetical protein